MLVANVQSAPGLLLTAHKPAVFRAFALFITMLLMDWTGH
jgi:hypothetical protein